MLGLDFAPASSAGTDLNLARVVGRRVTQTEQNREYSASPFYYGNGGNKFRKSEILCSARWAASLIVVDHLRRRFARPVHFKNGQIVLQEGEFANRFYLIESGKPFP